MSESPHPVDGREFVDLDTEECMALLHLEHLGRVAIADDAAPPDVFPVNYVLEHGAPVFRTHDGATLEHLIGKPVTLQVDRFDWFHRTGWSVLVQGAAELVQFRGAKVSDLDSWAPGPQPRVVRIVPARVCGRRIELHQRPLDVEGYL